jgi:hypothetical protein
MGDLMATRPSSQEIEEAVILSGARKGTLIRLTDGKAELTGTEAWLLDERTESARRLAESAHAASTEADALLRELRQVRAM